MKTLKEIRTNPRDVTFGDVEGHNVRHKDSGKHIGFVNADVGDGKTSWAWGHQHTGHSFGGYPTREKATAALHAHHDDFKKKTAALLKKL